MSRRNGSKELSQGRIESPRPTVEWETSRGEKHDDRGRGVTNILRAYKGQPTFGGLYDEQLEAVAENYAETA